MKKILLKVCASNYGILIKWVAGAIVGVLVALLTKAGISIDDATTTQLAGIVTLLVTLTINEYVISDQAASAQQVQAMLQPLVPGVRQDKVIGAVTLDAVAQVVEAAKTDVPMPVTTPTPAP